VKFFNLSYLYEVVRTNFLPIFGVFEIFDRNFAKIVAPPGSGNGKERSFAKRKTENRTEINRDAVLVRTMHPSNAQRSGLGA